MRAKFKLALPGAVLALASCSFIVGGTFKECDNDAQCAADKVCLKSRTDTSATAPGYCVSMPEACSKELGEFGDPTRIPFAAALPLSSPGLPDAGGTVSATEQNRLNAMKLAVEEINTRGIAGRKIALYVCNTGRESARIQDQVRWFSEQLGAKAVLFSGSSQGIAAHEPAKADGTLLLSATATSPELISQFQTSGLLWRTATPDTLQGKVLVDFIKSDPSFNTVTNVSVVYVDDAYGQGLKSVIQTQLTAPYNVRTVPYTAGTDLAPVVNALALQAPQLTVLIAFPAEATQILSLAAQKPNLTAAQGHRWMFTDSAKSPQLLSGGALPEIQNSFGFAPAQGKGIAFNTFRDSFLVKYGVDPATYSFTSHSYDATYVLALVHAYALGAGGALDGPTLAKGFALLEGGPVPLKLEPTNLTAMLSGMSEGKAIDIEGASGKLDFNLDAGAPGAPIERWQIMPDGGFETRDLQEPPLTL